jgi:hypothetical protein
MLVAESFLRSLVQLYGKNIVYYDDDRGTWYPEACATLSLKHIDYIQCLKKASF